ncbi:MAG: acyltransferase [Bacteroidales bacterium]|nr:acyltransferase [Bacteroidales bacterium]MDD5989608.1 acyltransferase [Bacteroidales bacterium]
MPSLLHRIIDAAAWPVAKVWNENLSRKCSQHLCALYAAIVRRRFKYAPHFTCFGYPFEMQGGRYISIGRGCIIGKDVRLNAIDRWQNETFTPEIIIGEHTLVSPRCHIGCINRIIIGNHVTLGDRVYITDHVHGHSLREEMDTPPFDRPLVSRGGVTIEDFVQIGENCVVLPGVTIGRGTIVGAGAIVTKDLPPYCVAAGNPAKVIKQF